MIASSGVLVEEDVVHVDGRRVELIGDEAGLLRQRNVLFDVRRVDEPVEAPRRPVRGDGVDADLTVRRRDLRDVRPPVVNRQLGVGDVVRQHLRDHHVEPDDRFLVGFDPAPFGQVDVALVEVGGEHREVVPQLGVGLEDGLVGAEPRADGVHRLGLERFDIGADAAQAHVLDAAGIDAVGEEHQVRGELGGAAGTKDAELLAFQVGPGIDARVLAPEGEEDGEDLGRRMELADGRRGLHPAPPRSGANRAHRRRCRPRRRRPAR